MPDQTDVAIVGAGLAGLAAGVACHRRGLRVMVVDSGPPLAERDRHDPKDIASGVGGAGLYSDGKFSFFPSATELWSLQPQDDLVTAYSWFEKLVGPHQVDVPPFPLTDGRQLSEQGVPPFIEKNYNSQYMSLTARMQMVADLAVTLGRAIQTGTSLENISFGPKCGVDIELRKDGYPRQAIKCRAVILGTGRLGPLLLQKLLPESLQAFRRLEIGVRIEQPSDKFFLRDAASLDPKRIWTDLTHNREWRTFCCCREGEIVAVRVGDILSVSGRSDVPPTGRSSVGFHLRLLHSQLALQTWTEFKQRLVRLEEPISEPMATFLNPSSASALRSLLGSTLQLALEVGLRELLRIFPDAASEATLHAPAVEGVGNYPAVSAQLKLANLPMWVAGDACGLFRGITAAGVSGYFSGIRVSRFLGKT
jgi:uncharacterized FAD-dependent dehydrogenase